MRVARYISILGLMLSLLCGCRDDHATSLEVPDPILPTVEGKLAFQVVTKAVNVTGNDHFFDYVRSLRLVAIDRTTNEIKYNDLVQYEKESYSDATEEFSLVNTHTISLPCGTYDFYLIANAEELLEPDLLEKLRAAKTREEFNSIHHTNPVKFPYQGSSASGVPSRAGEGVDMSNFYISQVKNSDEPYLLLLAKTSGSLLQRSSSHSDAQIFSVRFKALQAAVSVVFPSQWWNGDFTGERRLPNEIASVTITYPNGYQKLGLSGSAYPSDDYRRGDKTKWGMVTHTPSLAYNSMFGSMECMSFMAEMPYNVDPASGPETIKLIRWDSTKIGEMTTPYITITFKDGTEKIIPIITLSSPESIASYDDYMREAEADGVKDINSSSVMKMGIKAGTIYRYEIKPKENSRAQVARSITYDADVRATSSPIEESRSVDNVITYQIAL